MTAPYIFVTQIDRVEDIRPAQWLVASLRQFGGTLSHCPIWVCATTAAGQAEQALSAWQVKVLPLTVADQIKQYPFGTKVAAYAYAEERVPANIAGLIWLDLNCLVVQPPALFSLTSTYGAAVRPVHVRNVGLLNTDPLDDFWRGIYAAVGVTDTNTFVESFIDRQTLRSYFNSHGFALNPKLGLGKRWLTLFTQLVNDKKFQATACADHLHQIFLFQALWSALLMSALPPEQVLLLPSTYNYPYNLHSQVPPSRQAQRFNDLVCFTFEGREINPAQVTDIKIDESLVSWLNTIITTDA